jgi:hypothetical protein
MASYDFTPSAKNIANIFDYFGMLLGLPRLPGEKNDVYRKRLWDVYVHRASSTEQGLINGITRELGLAQYDALTISITDPESVTGSPRVLVHDTQIELYSNWNLIDEDTDANVLEVTLDIYSLDGNSYYLSDLVSEIDNTTTFSAALATDIDGHTLSAVLLNTDSRQWVNTEEVKPFHRNKLENTNIVPGTVQFSSEGRFAFVNQKDTEVEVTVSGDYYIDYENGAIISYSLPSREVFVRYMYDSLPLTLKASPVILHEFASEYFRNKVFEQVLQPDGTYEDGLPLNDAVEIINELFGVQGMLWGS